MLERKILVYNGYRDTVSPLVKEIARDLSPGITVDSHIDYSTLSPALSQGYDLVVFNLQLPGSQANNEKRRENEDVLEMLNNRGLPVILVTERFTHPFAAHPPSPPVATGYSRKQISDIHSRFNDTVKYGILLDTPQGRTHLQEAISRTLTNPVYLLDRVGIIGLGRIGFEAAYSLLQGVYNLRSLVVAQRNDGTLGHKAHINFAKLGETIPITAHPRTTLTQGSIDDIIQNAGIVIVSIGNHDQEKRMIRREELLQANLLPTIHLAEQFRNYQGHVLLVTNPTDLLALAFHLYSRSADGSGPTVTGMNYLDYIRVNDTLRDILKKEGYESDVDFRLVGTHTDKGPVLSNLFIGGIPWERVIFPEHTNKPWLVSRGGTGKMKRGKPLLETIQKQLAIKGGLIRELANGDTNEKLTAGSIAENIGAIQRAQPFYASTLIDLLITGGFTGTSFAEQTATAFPHGMYMGWNILYRGLGVEPRPLTFEGDDQRTLLLQELLNLRKRILDHIRSHPQDEWTAYSRLINFFNPRKT